MNNIDKCQIARQGFSTSLYDMPLLVTYNMTYMCNYHCTYCGQHNLRPRSSDCLPAEKIRSMFLNIRKLNRPEYLVTLSGGEPTIHPEFVYTVSLLEEIFEDKLSCLTIITNGSRNPDVYRELLRFSKNLPLELCISLHTDHLNPDHIMELIDQFSGDAYLNLQLMYNPDKREFVHKLYSDLCKLRTYKLFDLYVVQLRDFSNKNAVDARYTDEDFIFIDSAWQQFQRFASQSEPAKARNKNCKELVMATSMPSAGGYAFVPITNYADAQRKGAFAHKGKHCVMGTHQILVHPDGTAANAICGQAHRTAFPLYEKCPYEDPEFANISICQMENCGCYTNHFLQKFLVKEEAENYLVHFRIKARRYEEEFCKCAGIKAEISRKSQLLRKIAYSDKGAALLDPCNEEVSAEISSLAQSLKPVRDVVDDIDPKTVAILCAKSALVEAATHYRIILDGNLPHILLTDWTAGENSCTADIARQLQCEIAPFDSQHIGGYSNLCVYCRPDGSGYGSKDAFINFEIRLHEMGMPAKHFVAKRTFDAMKWKRMPMPEYRDENREAISRIYEKLADEDSRQVFLSVLKSIETGDPGYLPISPYPQYRHPHVRAHEGDFVISGGILNGATSINFSKQVGQNGRVVGFEPIYDAYLKCVENTQKYDNITVENLGLWSSRTDCSFLNLGGASRVTSAPGSGDEICHMVSIDEYVRENRMGCDLVKLDIEGAEPDCLEGAIDTIQLFKPRLQISLYHRIERYLLLPLWIIENFPFYTLYMGHHTPWYGETCLYATAE